MNGGQNKEEEYLAYLCSRIQRATEAVYRVTDLFSDKEPMKWKMREESTFIFTHLAVMKNKHSLERGAYLERIADSTDRLSILFSLFGESGSVVLSSNFRVLKKEYEAIKNIILQEAQKQDISHLFLPEKRPTESSKAIDGARFSNRQSENKMSDSLSDKPAIAPAPISKPVIKNIIKKVLTEEGASKGQIRKDKILKIIKDKERVTVGELSAVFEQYSEKTIQRDLLGFVSQGVLRKEGDKRWRSYILI